MEASSSGFVNNPFFLNLISGLLGSVIGAGATIYATKRTIQQTTQEAFKLEKQKREWDKKDAQEKEQATTKSIVFSLYHETKENLKSIELWSSYRRKFRFSRDSWDSAKPYVQNLPEALQNALVTAYAQMRRHNSMIDYDLRVPWGLGSMDAEIERQVNETKTSLDDLKKQLDSVLS